jgi:hypothetical protein
MTTELWTREFVTMLCHSGGFEGIAKIHNRELEKIQEIIRTPKNETLADSRAQRGQRP